MNFQTMSKQRKFVLISAVVGIISMFLPWVSISMFGYSGGSINGMHGNGILVFICFLASGGIAYLGDQTKNLDKTMWAVTLLAGVIGLLLILWFFQSVTGSMMGSSLIGLGVYIAGIAALGVLLSAYLLKSPADNLKDGFNSMKKDIESKIGNAGNTAPASPTASTPPPPPATPPTDAADSETTNPS